MKIYQSFVLLIIGLVWVAILELRLIGLQVFKIYHDETF